MGTEICYEVNCDSFDQSAKEGMLCSRHRDLAGKHRVQLQNGQLAGQYNATEEEIRAHGATGAKRSSDADLYRFDLIPQHMLERVAKVMSTGAGRYGAHNWEKGFSWSSLMNHLLRHAYLYLVGDKTEDHLAHMVCNLGFLIEFETTHPELNDIPTRQG